MRKTNKNLTKQILTLTLAFVLVFTGMGIGRWGVDEAWADESQNSVWDGSISRPENGDGTTANPYQISTGAELAWFAGLVNGTLTDGTAQNTAANAVLTADIDLNNKNWTPIGPASAWVSKNAYQGSFDGNGKTISHLYINNGAQFSGLFGGINGEIKNILITQSEVTATTGAILVGLSYSKGIIQNCAVTNSTLTPTATSPVNSAALCATNKGLIANCYGYNNKISCNFPILNGSSTVNGNVGGLIGNAQLGIIQNCYVAKTTIQNSDEGKTAWGMLSGNNPKAGSGNCYYEKNADDQNQYDSPFGEEKTIGWLKTPEALTMLGSAFELDESKNDGYPSVKIKVAIDKSKLEDAINKAKNINKDEYYTSDDKYNAGKTSQKGFWTDMLAVIDAAQQVYDNAKSQNDIEKAAATLDQRNPNSELSKAIANLIPKTQLNATALYEAIQERGNYPDEYLEDFTTTSVANYRKALKEAQEYLATLFAESEIAPDNPRGATTENIFDNQDKANGYADKLKKAVANLVAQETITNARINKKTIDALAKLYDMTENNGEYTKDSWSVFTTARENAVNHAKDYPVSEATTGENLKKYSDLARAFQSAVYGLTPAKAEIEVSFTYTDDYHLRVPTSSIPQDPAGNVPVKGSYTVEQGTKILDFLQQKGYTYSPSIDSRSFEGSHLSRDILIVNGSVLYGATPGQQQYFSELGYVLKDGDEVQLVHMDWPNYVFNYIYREQVSWDKMADILGTMHISGKQSANSGESINLTIERTSAHPWTYTGKYSAYEGATLAAYGPQQADGSYPKTPILSEGVSKEDGSVSMKLYEAGKYIITAYDARENNEDKSLFYSGNVAAPYFEVTVAEAEDSSILKKELKTTLDKVYKEYPQEYFRPENWTDIQNAYNEAAAVLNRANSTVAEAYNAQQTVIKTIQGIQETTTTENTNVLATFRKHLNRLPDDITLITKSVESTVTALINTYNGMSKYQQNQLTALEDAKYKEIEKLDLSTLPEGKEYKLNLKVTADTPEATEQIKKVMQYLHDNPARMDRRSGGGGDHSTAAYTENPYSFNVEDSKANPLSGIRFYGDLTYNAYFHNSFDSRDQSNGSTLTFSVPGTDCMITDENISFIKNGKSLAYDVNGSLTLNVDGTAYELKSITYEGLEESDVAYGTLVGYDDSVYKGKNHQWINMNFTMGYLGFTMPYNDVTITLNWGPVTSAAELQAAKDSAKSVLEETFAGYVKEKTSYSEANWTILENAYNTGKSSIEAATTLDEVAAARKDAITAMAKVKKEGTTVSKPDSVGTVYVTVENTTFTNSKWEGKTYWEGQLVDNMPIEITNDSTMMSCVVEALEKVGASQEGAESNYISEITDKAGHSLAEFDGGPNSGWMGTLNDWFTNYGFGSFTVANGGLGDGDEIRIMYTTNGLGEDLGGSWANSDTTLKDLAVSGGKLTPSFTSGTSGNTYEYTLLISGKTANVKVTPTASNKNFLTKIFLNEKVTNNTQGASFYKRTQYIPVTAGDTIYVGCGERQWASMNNQEGNVQTNGGTWYVIKVVSGDNAKEHIEKAINALPAADKVKLSNYKTVDASVKEIESLLKALSSADQAKIDQTKLKAVKEKVKFYTEIDDVKAKLNALTDSSSSSQAKAALDAYNKLNDEQKKYITEAAVKKFNELAKKYSLSGISGAAEMPESEVETTGKTGSATTTSPAEVKMSGTTATVTVKADNQKEILKQAKEKKSAEVVLTVAEADSKGAEKYELNLDKSFIQSLIKDTTAKLVVKTPIGQKTYDREALQKLVDEATTAVIKAEINKDNLDRQIEEPTVDVKVLTAKLTPVARSAKTAKKNVKVTVSLDKQDKEILSQLKEAGYTVKYRFYRSTKKSAGYKSTVTKKTAAYTNTIGKKGTKYFYKVQVRVYDEKGKLVAKTALKQCKYASRTWTKK